MQDFENIIIRSLLQYLALFLVSLGIIFCFQGYSDMIVSLLIPFLDICMVKFFFWRYHDCEEEKFILLLFCVALALRLAGVLVMGRILEAYNGMPFISFKDDYIYHEASLEIMRRWKSNGLGFYDDLLYSTGTYSGFPNFGAATMCMLGASPWAPRIGNAFLSSVTVVLAYILCRGYASLCFARFTGTILCFLPLTIIYSSLQMKDTLLLFFVVVGLLSSSFILRQKRVLPAAVMLVLSYLGILYGRPSMIVALFGALLLVTLDGLLTWEKGNRIAKVLTMAIVMYLMLLCYQYLDTIGLQSMEEHFYLRYQKLTEATLAESAAQVRHTSIAKYLGAPLYLAMGFFLPPALLVNVDESINYASFAVLQHLAFVPFLIVGIVYSFIERKRTPVLLFLFLTYMFLRVGQAFSLLTCFSPRQSLTTLFVMYLMLPVMKPIKPCWLTAFLIMQVVVVVAYNLVRLYTHGML